MNRVNTEEQGSDTLRFERYLIGLTGGIGSGKSWVSDHLAQLGVQVVDSDVVAHQLTAPGGSAMGAIRQAFGADFIASDGSMDRARMRAHVFAFPAERQRLEAILHPMIGAAVQAALAQPRSLYQVVVVPLLVEKLAAWRSRIDRLCVVDCEPATQIQRVKMRNGLAEDVIRKIIAAQANRETRLAAADDVIFNGAETDLKDLQRQVQSCHAMWLEKARHAAGRRAP